MEFMSLQKLNHLWGQRGFTLPEIMVGTAILAGVALAGATLFKDQNKAQSRLEHDKALSQFHTSVGRLLENNMHCNATVGSPGASISSGTAISSIRQCTANCYWDVDAGTMTTSNFISEGEWTDNTQIWQVTDISYVGTVNTTGPLRMRITYQSNPRIGARTISKDIMLGVRFGGGTYRGCASDQQSSVNNLQNDLCKSLTSITSTGSIISEWDDATQTCRLRDNLKDCTAQGLMVEGIRPDGSVHCRSIGTGFNLESGSAFDGTSSSCAIGTTARLITNADGKLRVVCQ